jgi:hypothetical protein
MENFEGHEHHEQTQDKHNKHRGKIGQDHTHLEAAESEISFGLHTAPDFHKEP